MRPHSLYVFVRHLKDHHTSLQCSPCLKEHLRQTSSARQVIPLMNCDDTPTRSKVLSVGSNIRMLSALLGTRTTLPSVATASPYLQPALTQGQNIARQKLTPQKSSWMFSGISQQISVSLSNGNSNVCGISQRIVTCPVDFYWKCPMVSQWHFPMEFHVCGFWCVTFCPEDLRRDVNECKVVVCGIEDPDVGTAAWRQDNFAQGIPRILLEATIQTSLDSKKPQLNTTQNNTRGTRYLIRRMEKSLIAICGQGCSPELVVGVDLRRDVNLVDHKLLQYILLYHTISSYIILCFIIVYHNVL